MSDIVRPCCWICVPKCSPPETQRFEVGLAGYILSICASNARMEAWGPSLASLGPVKVSGGHSYAMLLGAKLGILRASWGIRRSR